MSAREIAEFFWTTFRPVLMKFGYKNSKMVQVNQFFKPPYYFPGRISSKIGQKVVQENCEVMSTFHITLIVVRKR